MNPDELSKIGLQRILYYLHSLDDVYDEIKYEKLKKILGRVYSPEEKAEMHRGVKWALENKSFDFKSFSGVRQPNELILVYLERVDTIFVELLEDSATD